ncbi:AraC family transcriptional regulator [Terrimonas sp. NA20]|uniref:AraC family transcriptional regulator n=1 Tax=Terrimonas ginsenosidimutans TaxID=2908004 RepID=A0ABS9KQJ4_9BACT|nr:helix-turn-helix domain-containing protein [Terrimonas ginsenosidimutans]MCG2614575.1 AraC family transcriptional regulator [Terrimonas ginsenosidimutans]
MHQAPDIWTLAYKQAPMQEQMSLIHEKEQQVPGSVQYTIKRFKRNEQWNMEDTGMMVYHYEKEKSRESFLELKFCISGNVYCRQKDTECDKCKLNTSKDCLSKEESVDLLSFKFTPAQLSQFVKPRAANDNVISDEVMAFKRSSSFTKILPLCGKSRMVLEAMLNNTYAGSLENIFVNAQIQMLLLHSLDCMVGEKEIDTISCKFLANEADRDKIVKAREVLIQHIGEPITIKELSRKVAMNECYLKKGFKEMFGTTIFDFYQSQRMEHAKYLLYEKGLSVTEVSLLLGYSSISHFSTAFKKHTGLKPCELLLR